MYEMAKHLHLTAVVVSIILFTFQFLLAFKGSTMLQKRWLKIVPHVINTILLATAIWLVMISPMGGNHAWVASKVIGVVLYIVSGVFALKWAKNNRMRVLGYASALIWFLVTMGVAFSKQPFAFLA